MKSFYLYLNKNQYKLNKKKNLIFMPRIAWIFMMLDRLILE